MATLTLQERFDRDLPLWILDIEKNVYVKVAEERLTDACRSGDLDAIRAFLICYWPFVEEFPKLIHRGCFRLARNVVKRRLGSLSELADVAALLSRAVVVLNDIEGDETSHRQLWLETAVSVGLDYKELKRPALPEVKAIGALIGDYRNPFRMFLCFVAVEMIAEAVSKAFLDSSDFLLAVPEKGRQWFEVHITHEPGEMTHEEWALRLAFAFYFPETNEPYPTRSEVEYIIQETIDLFVVAGRTIMIMLRDNWREVCALPPG